MSFGAAVRNFMHREPIIAWSCIIASVGLILPLVVPPIRERFSPRDTVYPPPIKQLIEGVNGKGVKGA